MIPVNFDISILPAPVLEMLLNATATETTTFGRWLHASLQRSSGRPNKTLHNVQDYAPAGNSEAAALAWTLPELDDGELKQAIVECANATFAIEGRQLELVDDQTRWDELAEGARLFFELGRSLMQEAKLRSTVPN